MLSWKKIIKSLKKSFFILTVLTVIFSSMGSAIMPVRLARAASTITASVEGLPTQMPGEKISANSFDMPILKISVTASQAGRTLQAVTANFSGTGFATTDLAAIATDGTSGVALYEDTNSNGFYNPGGTDSVITLAASPDWTPATTNITLTPATPFSLPNGTAKIFFLVIKTSGTISNGDQIIATIPASAVITSDGNGPASNFSSNYLLADTTPVAISTVSGAVGSATLNVKFSKPVRKAGTGFNPIILADTPFTFVDNGTVNTHTITAVSHTAGQDFVQITLSAALDSGDLDGTPSTIAAGTNKISDMGGVAVGTGAVAISNPLNIATASIPSTVVGTNYTVTSPAPLVTFTAGGGTGPYTWEAAAAGDATVLATLGLSITASGGDAGKLVGTVLNVPGSYSVNIKVTDSLVATSTKMFNINVAPSGGGGIPGISSVAPGGGPKGAVSMPITVTGVNTHFSGSSTVQFWKAGANDTDMTVTSIASSGATNLTFNLAIAGGATEGSRDVKITTGSEQATMPNGFNVFTSGGSGLGLLMPTDAATGVQMPPTFNFDPSTNGTINSYRIDLNTTSNFAGTTLWDYVFPKPADVGNSNNSHCNTFGCNTGYGEGRFMILTPPTALAPNTTYYWRVRTYAETPSSTISSATAVESTAVRSFTTTASMSDVEPPMVMHRPIFQATASTDLNVIARVMDNLATATSTPALTTSLFYCAGAACSPTTEATSTSLAAGYYKYIIPSATISTAGTVIRYYISATDGTNTRAFKQPDGTTPFQLTSVAVGAAASITGNVKDTSDANLTGALVFAEGTGFLSAATGADGNFTLGSNNLFAGTYDLVAIKEGYGDPMINGIPAGSTGIQFRLGQGFGGGFGGDTAKPRVKFTGPMDGMNGVPGNDLNFKIFVAFDKSMSQSKFTESGNMLVKRITDFSTNPPTTVNIAGSWTYYSANPGIPMLPPEGNLAVFTPTEVFGENKTILVSVTSSITDTAGNSVQSNQSDGSYSFMFTTGSNVAFSGNTIVGGTFGQGAFMPPHVKGTMPSPGAFDVPRNSKVIINFSDPMADDSGGYILKNNIALYTVSGGIESSNIASSAIDTVLLDSTKISATVNLLGSYNSGTFAASTIYRLKVLGGAKAASGMTIAPPDQTSNAMFTAEFKTSATSDTAAPNIVGSYPSAGDTGTPVNIGAISVGFSKDMDMSTITSSNVYLSIGSTAINGTVEYRGVERQAFFIPSSALNPNTTYTINVTTSVLGVNGVATAATGAQPLTRNFTTGSADSVTPEIMFVNADDYAVAITFSEPMNAAKATDTLNWSTSVLNPAVYNVIKYGAAGFDPVATGTVAALTTATFKYDAISSTLMIEGLALTAGQELYLSMDVTGTPASGAQIAKDLSGNGIATPKNIARAPIKSSVTTKGALGPNAMGTSAFEMGGGFVPTNFSSATFGFAPPVDVMPFNKMAGQTTIYGVRLPISQRILAGGMIVLTFPTGFDVSGAKQDINSPMRTDLNGPGTGTVTFKCLTNVVGGKSCASTANTDDTGTAQGGLADDGVVVNTSARTVTIYLSANTRSDSGDTHDFLTIDIAGIKNSTVPKDFNTSGYTIDIKTKNSDTVLESLTSMPFFIQGATGTTYTLGGTITATGATDGTMKVYLMSPMTGPMEQEIDFGTLANGTAAYSFAGLPSGGYGLFTDQFISLTGGDFAGRAFPENLFISANKTYNFTLTNAITGTTVTVSITGGPASEPMDIFANSPTGFRVAQITLNGSGAGTATLKLPDGQWYIGAGPQMPKGPMSGPPPAPGYLPPKPLEIKVANPTVTENSGTANDGTIVFALTNSTKQIRGLVQDATGKTMANAEVFAYSPQGGFGTNAKTDSNGSFTLRVSDGIYVVGAFIPGMPPSKEVSVSVTNDAATYLLINGSATAITPAAAATSFIVKVAKPDYTISGKVTDGTNVVQGASVYAYRTNGPGNANAITDSSGNYTLYVSGGTTWKVGTFLPQYGNLTELNVAVTTENVANQNFSPSQTGTFRKVSGTVTSGGSNVQGAFVTIRNTTTSNEAITATDGTYSFNVPVGTGYIVRATIPGVGETAPLAAFDVAGSDITGKDISPATAPKVVTITFSAAPTKAFVELASVNGTRNRVEVNNALTAVLSVPNGDYNIKVDVPGTAIGLGSIAATTGSTIYSSTTGIVTVDGAEGLTVAVPTTRTLTGTVKVGVDNLADAWVEIFDPANGGVHFGVKADANGAFSMKVADGTYKINAMKPGYYRDPSTLIVDGTTAAQTITVVAASTTIGGTVYIGVSGAANAFIRAEKQGGGFAGTQADANGVYSLYVTSGVWRVYAVAEGYAETAYTSNPIDVTGGSVTGKNITVATAVNVAAPKSKSITPANGGTIEDTETGIKVTFPGTALGSSTASGNVEAKETNNVRETSTAKPLKSEDPDTGLFNNSGKTVTATVVDSTGSSTAVTTLNPPATIEMSYTKAELAATSSATDSSINTKAEADAVKMGYWDESSASWVTQPTTITYKDGSGNVITDVTTIDTAPEFAATVATVIISATTDHLSLYAPVSTVGTTPPDTPTGLTATAASSSSITLNWTASSGATSYDVYRSTSSGGTFTRLGDEPTVGAVTTYSSTGLSASTPYYYKISALNATGESVASSEVTATTSAAASSGGGGGYIPAATTVTGASILIAGGAVSTTGTVVTLALAATNATQMAIANTADFADTGWETYAASKAWTLTSGEGVKTVYVKFRDAAGTVSSTVSDTITLASGVAPTTTPLPAPATPAAQSGVTLYRAEGDSRVYVIKDGKKTWIKTAEDFIAAGYKWDDIIVTTPAVVAAYPDAAVTVVKVKVVGTPILRVRKSNTTASVMLTTVKRNETFTVLEQAKGWYKITTSGGIIGWISGAYTEEIAESVSVPEGAIKVMVTPQYLRIRSLNSTSGKILGVAKKGEIYSVLEEKSGWYKIKTSKGVIGWISAQYATKQ